MAIRRHSRPARRAGSSTGGGGSVSFPLTVTSVSPASGASTGQTPFAVFGTGFLPGDVVALTGIGTIPSSYVSATQINAQTPVHSGTTGALAVTVTHTAGGSGSLAAAFTFASPVVTSVFPSTGPLAGGTFVQVSGLNIGTLPTVTIGGASATSITRLSESVVQCKTPAGSSGAANVVIGNTDGQTSGTSGNGAFTFAANAAARTVDFTDTGTYTAGFLSAASFLSKSGLTFTRASGATDTVQTSASTIVIGSTNDSARIGNNGSAWGQGLVFEETRGNYATWSRALAAHYFTSGGGATKTGGVTGPDGTANASNGTTDALGSYSLWNQFTAFPVSQFAYSQWVHGAGAGTPVQWSVNNNAAGRVGFVGTVGTAWAKTQAIGNFTTAAMFLMAVEGRAESAGQTQRALNFDVDFPMLELGKFVTEAVVTTSGTTPVTRAAERVKDTTLANWLDTSVAAIEMDFVPKANLADNAGVVRFWTLDSTNYLEINPATGFVTLAINDAGGAATYTSAVAINWTLGDQVQIFASHGGNQILVALSLNGGASATLYQAAHTTSAISTSPAAIDFLSDGAGGKVLSAWSLRWIKFNKTNLPYWYSPPLPTSTTLDFTGQTAGRISVSAFSTAFPSVGFSRASAGTVQTSATTIDTTPATDEARIVDFGLGWKGLLIEETRTNILQRSEQMTNSASWTITGTTAGAQTGPDGAANASKCAVTSGNTGISQHLGTTPSAPWTDSFWAKTTASGGPVQYNANDGTTPTWLLSTGVGTAWSQYQISSTWTPGATVFFAPFAGAIILGGGANTALDYTCDFPQREAGLFATSAIITPSTAAVTRAADRLTAQQPASWVASARAAIEYNIAPLADIAKYGSSVVRLHTIDSQNYVEINCATQVLTVAVAGATAAFFAIGWSALDEFDLFVAAGGGALSTICQYRSKPRGGSQGATFVLPPLAALGTVPTPLGIDLLSNGTSNTFSAAVKKIHAITDGSFPSWCYPVPLLGTAQTRKLVTDGDSITFGAGLVAPYNNYTVSAADIIGSGYGTPSNVSHSGDTIQDRINAQSTAVFPLFDGTKAKNICSIFAGTNNIAQNQSAATAFAQLKTYCSNTKANNAAWIIPVWTMLPRNGLFTGGQTGAAFETARQAFNAAIRAEVSPPWDVIVDAGADPLMGAPGACNNAIYYQGDFVHPTKNGQARLAGFLSQALATIG